MKKCYKVVVIGICIIIMLVIGRWGYPNLKQYSVCNDYKDLKNNFNEVVVALTEYDFPIIYAGYDNLIVDDKPQTINSLVTQDLMKMEAWQQLDKAGYKEFVKQYGGIYFYKFFNFDRSRGLMYYPNGFKNEYNGLITKWEKLDNNWYYFEER